MKKLDFSLKTQKICSKTQPIGGQVPPVTSLRVPPKNPGLNCCCLSKHLEGMKARLRVLDETHSIPTDPPFEALPEASVPCPFPPPPPPDPADTDDPEDDEEAVEDTCVSPESCSVYQSSTTNLRSADSSDSSTCRQEKRNVE